MIVAIPDNPQNMIIGIEVNIKMYFILLSFIFKFLNFKENIGISDISNHENIIINTKIIYGFMSLNPIAVEAQNKAFAGVGKPMNDILCLSSKLNLANLNAEKTAIENPIYGIKFWTGTSIVSPYSLPFNIDTHINDGAKPKLMSSARESNSLPIGDDIFNSLADIPSKKSKTALITIKVSVIE